MTLNLGRDAAARWLTDKRPEGAVYARRATTLRVAYVTGISLRESATLANSMVGRRVSPCPLKMILHLILRGLSPTCGSEYVKMVICFSHQLLARAISAFGLR